MLRPPVRAPRGRTLGGGSAGASPGGAASGERPLRCTGCCGTAGAGSHGASLGTRAVGRTVAVGLLVGITDAIATPVVALGRLLEAVAGTQGGVSGFRLVTDPVTAGHRGVGAVGRCTTGRVGCGSAWRSRAFGVPTGRACRGHPALRLAVLHPRRVPELRLQARPERAQGQRCQRAEKDSQQEEAQ